MQASGDKNNGEHNQTGVRHTMDGLVGLVDSTTMSMCNRTITSMYNRIINIMITNMHNMLVDYNFMTQQHRVNRSKSRDLCSSRVVAINNVNELICDNLSYRSLN